MVAISGGPWLLDFCFCSVVSLFLVSPVSLGSWVLVWRFLFLAVFGPSFLVVLFPFLLLILSALDLWLCGGFLFFYSRRGELWFLMRIGGAGCLGLSLSLPVFEFIVFVGLWTDPRWQYNGL